MKNKSVSKFFIGVFALIIFSMLITNCQKDSEIVSGGGGDDPLPGGKSIITGRVVSQQTSDPIDSALVQIFGSTVPLPLYTDSQGIFSFEVEFESDEDLMILTYKENYLHDTTEVTVIAGEDLNVPLIKLEEIDSSGSESTGDPVSIFLSSISFTTIGVKESGSQESTQIVFAAHDSAGRPIDEEHSVIVNFRLGAGPGGGEFLSPYSAPTIIDGKVAVTLTSGTKAGAVQIIAEFDIGGEIIASLPVAITIHGGLPDYDHFSIGPAYLNFAGYYFNFGLMDQITAFVGDKYANPVRPQTAVYFTTTGGIIEGSTLTDYLGIGSVELISALPMPFDSTLGAGFATITASTVDENSATISREIIVLFSGTPQMSVTPTSINIPNAGSQSFSYYVGDQNGNPLAGGTSINVSVEGDDVDAQGDLNFTLPDTQSPAWTQFNFLVYDIVDSVVTKPVTIRIATTGPNGDGFITISGTSQ